MTPNNQLKLSSIAIGAIWSAAMMVWSGVYDVANLVIMPICGILFAFGWYGIFSFVMRRAARNKTLAGR